MATVTIPDGLAARLDELATAMDGFENDDELVAFVLSEFVATVETGDGEAPAAREETDDTGDDVEEHLRDLGYI